MCTCIGLTSFRGHRIHTTPSPHPGAYPGLQVDIGRKLLCVQVGAELGVMVQEEQAKQVERPAISSAVPEGKCNSHSRDQSDYTPIVCATPTCHTHPPGYVLGHHGIETVKQIGSGQAHGQKGKEDLRPATVRGVAEVARLAVVGDDQLHVRNCLLLGRRLQA